MKTRLSSPRADGLSVTLYLCRGGCGSEIPTMRWLARDRCASLSARKLPPGLSNVMRMPLLCTRTRTRTVTTGTHCLLLAAQVFCRQVQHLKVDRDHRGDMLVELYLRTCSLCMRV
jgi:hypothetical protein